MSKINLLSYEAVKISHTFSMNNSGAQTCLRHESKFVPVQNYWERTHIHLFDIIVFGQGSLGECELTIGESPCENKGSGECKPTIAEMPDILYTTVLHNSRISLIC